MKLFRLLLSFWEQEPPSASLPHPPRGASSAFHRAKLCTSSAAFPLLSPVRSGSFCSVPLPVHADPSFPPAPSLNPQAH